MLFIPFCRCPQEEHFKADFLRVGYTTAADFCRYLRQVDIGFGPPDFLPPNELRPLPKLGIGNSELEFFDGRPKVRGDDIPIEPLTCQSFFGSSSADCAPADGSSPPKLLSLWAAWKICVTTVPGHF